MHPSLKIVNHLPLKELLCPDGSPARRLNYLTADNIKALLQAGPVQFVIADTGHPLHWQLLADCFKFWKSTVQPHIAPFKSKIHLDQFPGAFCYFASQWTSAPTAPPIILLEKHH